MALQPQTVEAVDQYWASFFGCPATHFAGAATLVVPHAGLGDYHGVWLFRRGAAAVISAPLAYVERLAHLASRSAAELWAQGLLEQALAGAVARVVGPAYLGYADAGTFTPHAHEGARLLTPADADALEALRQACPALDWDHGGSELGELPLAGAFADDTLVALAGYELWGERLAHIAVVAHPGYRGQGHAARAVSLLAEQLLARGLIAQYRTLLANGPSLRIAARLGFQPYAETLALRLREAISQS